ncbi:vWA domain-containing protein [Pseudorhodoferax sp.]|uniref:vWA domain-containing protein n=1 Tax=Pseudorhodoferax sp. TaxID=1993553 RepID=UPI002DD61D50|nr:VWA domain-containing protein [Pseudorhodoferax sp.]
MDSVLAGFVRALRAAGAEASTAETIDAARALALVGYADRAGLKAALGLVLAKSEDEKQIHDQVFDLYFGRPQAAATEQPAAPQLRTGDAQVDALLALAQPGPGGQGGDALAAALERAATSAGVDEIRFATQTGYYTRQTLDALGIAPLEARLAAQRADPEARAEVQALEAARDQLRRQARAVVQQRYAIFGKPATEAFMTEVVVTRALGRMAPAEMERMKAAVARMARKLAARHARRQRVELRGQLDLRRTMRANAGHDGVPVTLAFKHRRRDKPRIVAVCDVSGSVASHVRFLLLFLYALHDAVGDLRSFAFSNRLQDVAEPLEKLPFDDAMALILKEVGNGSTDYGQAWVDLHDRHWDAIDRRTTVIVLGDGRSNGADPRLDLFAELAGRAKRVVWLCPEAEGRWGTGDSAMLRYRPYCTSMSHCATAADLERTLDEALEAYH